MFFRLSLLTRPSSSNDNKSLKGNEQPQPLKANRPKFPHCRHINSKTTSWTWITTTINLTTILVPVRNLEQVNTLRGPWMVGMGTRVTNAAISGRGYSMILSKFRLMLTNKTNLMSRIGKKTMICGEICGVKISLKLV